MKQLKFMSFLLSHPHSPIVKAKYLTYALGYFSTSTIEIEPELRFSLMLRLHDIQDNIKRKSSRTFAFSRFLVRIHHILTVLLLGMIMILVLQDKAMVARVQVI